MGYLYKRGNVWWAKYYANGRPIRESTGSEKETEASRFLKAKEGRVATGQPVILRADRIRYEQIAADLRKHYKTSGERGLKEAETRLKHLDRFFRQRRVINITPDLVTDYIEIRQAKGRANATINRELEVLIRMLRLAYEKKLLTYLPVIHKLKEAAPRKGFFEERQFLSVRRRLREDLQVAVSIAYQLGWRMQSEVLTLTRAQIDVEKGTLRLEPGSTKNDDGREIYMTPELNALVTGQAERVKRLEKQRGQIIPWLFPHLRGRHQGQRIKEFRKTWARACEKAGCPGMLRHDFRRTAVRNLIRRGVPQAVAMEITGHRTIAVFKRYNIVSVDDHKDAARKLTGTIPGTVAPLALTGAT